MSPKRRALFLGAGGMAVNWITQFLPNFADRLVVEGLVDVSEAALATCGDLLGLPLERRFTDMSTAFSAVEVDLCIVVLPPAVHKEAVMLAVEHRLPILSEKPIADTWESCVDIWSAVRRAGIKMQVIQNFRYGIPLLTLREVLRRGDLGRINHIFVRFAADYREYAAWGLRGADFRHKIPHALLVEGAIHHFDIMRSLSGADCRFIGGWEWNPPWSHSKGEFCNLFVMTMTNGVRACYEGSGTGAGEQNSWRDEYFRVECEDGAVAVGQDHVVRVHRFKRGGSLTTSEVLPLAPKYPGHNWLINEFLEWLDGGPTPVTVIDDNIKTAAMMFAAIEASRTNQTIDVEALLRGAEL
jgi:predicted dehydrogenase